MALPSASIANAVHHTLFLHLPLSASDHMTSQSQLFSTSTFRTPTYISLAEGGKQKPLAKEEFVLLPTWFYN